MQEFDLIVIGGGPGGYLCAERAGKAGLRTALIEKRALGGTCLNEGCIPTKSLLYCAKQYQAALHGAEYGVTAQNVSIDHAQVVARKDGVVRTLVRGVGAAMKAHGVPALIRQLRGELSLEEAVAIGQADTRHYAKRQFTWFRHQLPEFRWVTPEEAGKATLTI